MILKENNLNIYHAGTGQLNPCIMGLPARFNYYDAGLTGPLRHTAEES
jgi:hypothetical protein